VVANKRFVKIFTPPVCSPRGVFTNLRVTFKLLLLNSDKTTVLGGFLLSNTTNVFNFSIGNILQ
jgi:hypothetical protein